MPTKQIIAMGGGGFLMESTLLMERYVLEATGKKRPKICFLPHATDESARQTLPFFEAHALLDCQPRVLSLYQTPPMGDIAGFLLDHDAIYVGGGNTKSMLAVWREWGVDKILRQAYRNGIVLAGVSAGANCWFEECVTDSASPQLSMLPCLGFLKGSFCPHYDGESERQPVYQRLIASGGIKPGIACDDGAAAHYIDGKLERIVASREHARGYALRRRGEQAQEAVLPAYWMQ
jgi:peptidase E